MHLAPCRQLSYLSIDESAVDSASEASDPTTNKTPSHSSPPRASEAPTFQFREHGSSGSKDTTPPAKRILPPRAIKSPRPRFRSSPYSPPKPTSPEKSDAAEKSNDFTFDLRSLTWQDSEITGHLLLDPDDDGEGINGIGFRPTPAMAFERSERRKRQVTEWRSRQAQDERQRRAERRRRAHVIFSTVDMQGQSSIPKKVVRFAV
jgi:hypothetical protein